MFFFFNDTATTEIYTLSLHDALPIFAAAGLTLLTQAYRSARASTVAPFEYTAILLSIAYGWLIWAEWPDPVSWIGIDRKSTRLNSSHANISYAVFCLKKKYVFLNAIF